MKYISSISNPEVKEILKLHDKEKRRKLNKCIVEGWRLILDAIKSGVLIEKVFVSKSYWEEKRDEIEKLVSFSIIRIVDDSLMKKISLLETPPGIMGVFPLFFSEKWEILKYIPDHHHHHEK